MCTCAFSMQQFPSSQGSWRMSTTHMKNVQSMYKVTRKQGVVEWTVVLSSQ